MGCLSLELIQLWDPRTGSHWIPSAAGRWIPLGGSGSEGQWAAVYELLELQSAKPPQPLLRVSGRLPVPCSTR